LAVVSILVKQQAAFCGKQDKVEGVDNEKDRSKDRILVEHHTTSRQTGKTCHRSGHVAVLSINYDHVNKLQ